MDSGLADILGSPKQWAPNSIAIFDLNTDKLIKRFVIPADQVKDDSFFANIVSFLKFEIIIENSKVIKKVKNQGRKFEIQFFLKLILKVFNITKITYFFPLDR